MTEPTYLPAGDFSAWLRGTRAALAGASGADVPCGDCCACCTTSHFVHVGPEEAAALAAIPRELLFPAPGEPAGTLLMGYDEHGRCPLVDAGGRCSIYEDRPRTCRTYDCRVFAAAGTETDNEVITRQARRWRFGYPAQQDRDEHAAVRAAARFVRERGECLPGGVAPRDPVGIALLAIEAFEVFRGPDPGVGGEVGEAAASGACTAADREAASAILAAHERFAARRTDADAARGG